ncbi:hypothetical protein ACVW2L_004357 [Mucilaginibacter sp. HD30]
MLIVEARFTLLNIIIYFTGHKGAEYYTRLFYLEVVSAQLRHFLQLD